MIEYIYLLIILSIILVISIIILTYVIIKFKDENTSELYLVVTIIGLIILLILPLALGLIDLFLKNI